MKKAAIVLAVFMFASPLGAEEEQWVSPSPVDRAGPESSPARRALAAGLVSAGIASFGLTVGTFAWWKDQGYSGWGWEDSGLFGENTYAGGSDKAGHIYVCYTTSKGMRQVYEWLGTSRRSAVALSAGYTFLVSTAVEVIDGFTPNAFEWHDVVANAIGLSFFLAGEAVPAIDALFGLRIGYFPSPDFVESRSNRLELLGYILDDYSGMIFFLDFKPAGLEPAFGVSPGPARYFTFGIAYGTSGYWPGDPIKRRNLGFHVSLNVSEIAGRMFGTERKSANAFSTFTRYYALPFTTVLYHRDLNHGDAAINFGFADRFQYSLSE